MTNLNLISTIDLIEQQYGQRYLLERSTILMYINVIQQHAFNKDLDCFLVWDNYLTINKKFTFSSGGYTNAVSGDVGKTVVGTTSTATGTLVSYNNTTKIWIVTPVSGTFLSTEAITITTGTGAGTLSALENYKGPYTISSSTQPIRKILGVTTLTELQFLYPFNNYLPMQSSLVGMGVTDYGWYGNYTTSFDNDRYKWITGRIMNFENTFTFINNPDITANIYRIVYYKNPVDIIDEDDTAGNYIIPDRFRHSLVVTGVEALAENAMYNTDPMQKLQPILERFWATFLIPNGNMAQDYKSEGFI